MLKASHVNIGCSVALASIIVTKGYISPLLVFYPLFSLLPDADHHSSSATKAFGMQLPGATHRGYSHSLLFVCGVALAIYFGLSYLFPGILTLTDLYIFLWISVSHLIWDLFTKKGIPLFYPFYKWNIGIPLFTTGTIIEKLITFIVSLVNIGLLFYIAGNYLITGVSTFGDYPQAFLLLALISQGWIFYLLFKEEMKFFKKNISNVVKNLVKITFFTFANIAILAGAYFLLIKGGMVNIEGIVSAMWMSLNTAIVALGVIGMLPSMVNIVRKIDEMSFPFASALNIIIGFSIFAGMIIL